MEIALDTFKKPATGMPSENIGLSTVTIGAEGYLELERLEQELLESGKPEVLVDADDKTVQMETPLGQDELREPRIRVFLDDDTQGGFFHVVARDARDGGVIYTEPTMVRLVAV
jgi:hypothetical protein